MKRVVEVTGLMEGRRMVGGYKYYVYATREEWVRGSKYVCRRYHREGSGQRRVNRISTLNSICESGQRVLTCGSSHMNRSRDTSSLAVLFISLTTCLLTR